MNRGHILQSSPVQQMMATGKPSCWWSMNNIRPAISQFEHHHQQQPQGAVSPSPFYPFSSAPPPPLPPATNTNTTTTTNNNIIFPHQLLMNMTTAISASSSLPFAPSSSSSWGPSVDSNQQEQLAAAEPWNQLYMGAGMAMSGDEKAVMNHQFQTKKIEDWEDHHEVLGIHHHQQHQPSPPTSTINVDHVKQENSAAAAISYVYGHDSCSTTIHEDYRAALKPITTAAAAAAAWSPHHQMMPVSSPQSCVTTFSNNNLLDFSSPISDARHPPPPPAAPSSDRSSECNSTANTTSGGPTKKAKVQPSSTQSTIKVRKEKLGDRITALHQLVSPFGKTDTASVLLEALGYIRFLHNQIEALSLPYLANNGSGNNKRQPQTTVQGERNSIFPEEPGQLLNNNNCLKRKGGPDPQDSSQEEEKNLRSRGLCLVPISCTLLVGSDNGADYWAPPALGGGFR